MNKGTHQALYGTTVEEVRWRECVSYVNSNMESAVGSLYIKQAFSKNSKIMVCILDFKWAVSMAALRLTLGQPPGKDASPVTPTQCLPFMASSIPIPSQNSVSPKGICINTSAHQNRGRPRELLPQALLTTGSSPRPCQAPGKGKGIWPLSLEEQASKLPVRRQR